MPQLIPNWHPVFVHFTVALLFTAGVLHLLAAMLSPDSPSRAQMAIVGRWNLWLGFLITIGTATAGFIAFDSVVHDDPAHAAMKLHRNFALATVALYLPFVIASAIDALRNRLPSGAFAFALLVPTALLVVTAWRGGELVFRHGLGVQSMPDLEAHDHDHEHRPADTVLPADAAPAPEEPEAVAPESLPPDTEELGPPVETGPAPGSVPALPEAASDESGRAEAGHEHSHGEHSHEEPATSHPQGDADNPTHP